LLPNGSTTAIGLKPVRPAFLWASRAAQRSSIQESPLTESAPVDPTATDAWKKLTRLADGFSPDLRGWFDADATRADRYTFQAADLTVDISKGLLTDEIMAW
jgi:glucose-6-phosphate isomerase